MRAHPADVTPGEKASESAGLAGAHRSDDGSDARTERAVSAALLGLVAMLLGSDVVLDVLGGAAGGHLLLEAAVFVIATGGLVWLARRAYLARREAGVLRTDLLAARDDVARWRAEAQELLQGLGAAIDRQFREWELSAAEREVGLLLLKGLSLKEIAEVRGVSERTVRQQAFAIYRKGNVAGRAELSAFFLEDLLLPAERGKG